MESDPMRDSCRDSGRDWVSYTIFFSRGQHFFILLSELQQVS